MYIEFTTPTGGRVYVRKDFIATLEVKSKAKGEPYLVTTTSGVTYTVTVETEQHGLARLVGMRA
jgi:hypothetical protein